ncbi:MAG: glycosyltransferase family 2 protein [Selenomonadaceae bacterium]|nr:glycosyltransferase family 2 protein [Selenomonadaceae bacterium]
MSAHKSLVSILIPTFNQPEFFRQALESALNQTYKNIEILVSDDSTDDRVEKIASEYKDRIRFFKHANSYTDEPIASRTGINLEFLLKESRGEFINVLYHDDLIYPEKISKMIKFFKKDRRVGVVASMRDFIDRDGNIIEDNEGKSSADTPGRFVFMDSDAAGRELLTVGGNFIGELTTVLIRREDFFHKNLKKFSASYFHGVKDHCMYDVPTYLEIFSRGKGLIFMSDTLSAFRRHKSQNTSDGETRLLMLLDYLAFIAKSYRENLFLHSETDLSNAFRGWNQLAAKILSDTESVPPESKNLIELLIRALDSITKQNLKLTIEIAFEWINSNSPIR